MSFASQPGNVSPAMPALTLRDSDREELVKMARSSSVRAQLKVKTSPSSASNDRGHYFRLGQDCRSDPRQPTLN